MLFAPAEGAWSIQTSNQLLNTIIYQQNSIQASIGNIQEQREVDRIAINSQFRIVNQNIKRVAQQPPRMLQRAHNQNQQAQGNTISPQRPPRAPLRAELSPNPKNLYTLWDEYINGIGGRKPASEFTREERGKVKHKYCRRKIVWDRIVLLINAGLTSQVACDRIYDVYGQSKSVTIIINALKKDIRNNSLHESLVV